jgi:DNA-directed RNA polymerase subunit L
MELTLDSQGSDQVQITFEGEDATLLNLLKQALLDHEDVDTASFLRGHPTLDDPTLDVVVDDGEPVEAVSEAATQAREDLEAFADLLDDEAG